MLFGGGELEDDDCDDDHDGIWDERKEDESEDDGDKLRLCNNFSFCLLKAEGAFDGDWPEL